MKRLLAAVACLAFTAPLFAAKPGPQHLNAPTATNTINGTPLTIVIGDDTSMQVFNSNVPGTGQFYPPDTGAGETANAGVFVSLLPAGGIVYGPSSVDVTAGTFTPVSMTPVTGTGTAVDPYTVVIVVNVGATLVMTETLTYANGSAAANISLSFSAVPPPSGPQGQAISFDAMIGADLYLADNDAGYPFAVPGAAAGSHAANSACTQQLQYTISFLGNTPADRYSANYYGTIWDEIGAGTLSNTIAPGCLDDGAALEWHELLGGTPIVISTGVSFTGQAVPVGAAVPALSGKSLAALVVLLAAVGYVLAKKTSLGA